jgi:pimeloyl-ACP methyl ester carboxylesterase
MLRRSKLSRCVPVGVSLSLAGLAASIGALATTAAPAEAADAANAGRPPGIAWSGCTQDPTAQCGALSVPVDWDHPAGPRFNLAVARRTATDPTARVGSLIFGPGGPGDSGVDRIVNGISRFDDELQRRFDIVSFDPRGVGGSNPVVCSADLLARQPSPVITSRSEYDATLAYNRRLAADCRTHTGPVYDHVDTASTVKDLDAIRAALGESTLTFHGSSYGTLLGEQYAEAYPGRVRAMVLESVVDHSLGTRGFLDTQAETEQDSFDEFVKWCDRTASCALHGRDVRAVWAELLARAGRGELHEPGNPAEALTPFILNVLAQKDFYDPDWAELAQTLNALDTGTAPTAPAGTPTAPTAAAGTPTADPVPSARPESPTAAYPFALFCQDWRLPVHDYRAYAGYLDRIATIAPDMVYPRALLAAASCLGAPEPVNNPQHVLRVRGSRPLLLVNSLHDPASGYNWATSVAGQLGDEGVLLTYEGWGHGAYNSSPCAQRAIDRYLITLATPAPGTHCPAVDPTPAMAPATDR